MIQFSDSVKTSYAFSVLACVGTGATTTNIGVFPQTSGAYSAITIYKGTQPTGAEFLANWAALYRGGKTEMLAHYPNATGQTAGWTRNGRAFVMTTFPTTLPNAVNSGTATWAVIWNYGRTPVLGTGAGSISIDTIYSTMGPFLIVPVTDLNGNGVIRFADPVFTSGQPKNFTDGAMIIG